MKGDLEGAILDVAIGYQQLRECRALAHGSHENLSSRDGKTGTYSNRRWIAIEAGYIEWFRNDLGFDNSR